MKISNTQSYDKRWLSLACICVSILIISLDNTVLNLALPSISRDLGSTSSQLQWMIDSYILVSSVLLLTMGYLGDRIGRKLLLQIGMAIFAVFSFGSAVSTSSNMLIVMRGLMGLGAAVIFPATLSSITAAFKDAKERGQAIAIWTAAFGLGSGIGPLIGGWLLNHFTWSSVFYINLPIAVMGIVGGQIFIRESKSENPRPIDIIGSVLSIIGLFSLVYGIIQAGRTGWTNETVLISLGIAVVLIVLFVVWELKYKNSMLPIEFFKNPSFSGANFALTLVSFAMFGSFFLLSQFLQSVQGYSPLSSGVRLLPMAIALSISAGLSARIAIKFGIKLTVAIGIFITAIAFFYFAYIDAVDTPYSLLALAMVGAAVGIGLTMSPATNSVMGSIPLGKSGIGSAMNSTTRQIGGALGVAILGSILNAIYVSRIAEINWPAPLPATAVQGIESSIQGAHVVAQSIPNPGLAKFIIDTANQAFVSGSMRALLIAAVIIVIAGVATLILLPSKIRPPTDEVSR